MTWPRTRCVVRETFPPLQTSFPFSVKLEIRVPQACLLIYWAWWGGLSVPSHLGTFVLHGEGCQVNVGPGTLRVAPIPDPMRFLACSLSSPEAGQGQDLRPWEQMDQIWPQA